MREGGGGGGGILCTDSKIVRPRRVGMTGGRPIKARGVTVQEVKPANCVPQGPAFKIKCLSFSFFFLTYYSDYMKQFQSGFKDDMM